MTRAKAVRVLRDAKRALGMAHALCEDVARELEYGQRARAAGDAARLLDMLADVEREAAALGPVLRRIARR